MGNINVYHSIEGLYFTQVQVSSEAVAEILNMKFILNIIALHSYIYNLGVPGRTSLTVGNSSFSEM